MQNLGFLTQLICFQDQFENLNTVDVESEEFKSLPPDIQHEIIMDMKERRKTHKMSRRTVTDLPEVCCFIIAFQRHWEKTCLLWLYIKVRHKLDCTTIEDG